MEIKPKPAKLVRPSTFNRFRLLFLPALAAIQPLSAASLTWDITAGDGSAITGNVGTLTLSSKGSG